MKKLIHLKKSRLPELPELCVACKELKMPVCGIFKIHTNGRKTFKCLACEAKEDIKKRKSGSKKPSYAEIEIMKAFDRLSVQYIREYVLGYFYYDFFIPSLYLIIEVDSVTYHINRRHNHRSKNETAYNHGIELVRVLWRDGMDIYGTTCAVIAKRKNELGIK
jgi:very-short-patch-repair endonuclease